MSLRFEDDEDTNTHSNHPSPSGDEMHDIELEENNVEKNAPAVGNAQKPETPLPWKQISIVFFIYLVDSLSITSIFAYIGFMVADFHIVEDTQQLGYFAGIIASSYYMSQLFSSFFWGYLSDKIGRRPILLVGVTLGSLSCGLFGFSKWLWWAILSRFLFGLLNGNLGVTKSYLTEITDGSNRGRAFSVVGVTFGLAAVVGPLIGGVFSRPNIQYPEFMKLFPEWIYDWCEVFPYLIPNIMVTVLGLIAVVLGYFFLEETNINSSYYRKYVLPKKSASELSDMEKDSIQSKRSLASKVELDEEPVSTKNKIKSFFKHEIFHGFDPLLTCVLYMSVGFMQVMFDEIFPLYAMLPISDNGLNFTPYEIVGAITGGFIFLNQLVFVPFMMSRLGSLNAFRAGLLIHIFALFVFPEVCWFSNDPEDPQTWKTVILWIFMSIILLVRQIGIGLMFSCSFTFTSNSVTNSSQGVLNGTAQSMVSVARMIGPLFIGITFASIVSSGIGFPIDHRFVFYLIGGTGILSFILTFFVKKKVNVPKDELLQCMKEKGISLEEAYNILSKNRKATHVAYKNVETAPQTATPLTNNTNITPNNTNNIVNNNFEYPSSHHQQAKTTKPSLTNNQHQENRVRFQPSGTTPKDLERARLEQEQYESNLISAVAFFLIVLFLIIHFFTQQKRHYASDYIYGLNMSLYLFHIQFNPNTLKLIKLSNQHYQQHEFSQYHNLDTISPTAMKMNSTSSEQEQTLENVEYGSVDSTSMPPNEDNQSKTSPPTHFHSELEDDNESNQSSMKTLSFYSSMGENELSSVDDTDVQIMDECIDENSKRREYFPSSIMILPPHLQRPEHLEEEIEIQESLERQGKDPNLTISVLEEIASESGYGMTKTISRNSTPTKKNTTPINRSNKRLYFHREKDTDDEEANSDPINEPSDNFEENLEEKKNK